MIRRERMIYAQVLMDPKHAGILLSTATQSTVPFRMLCCAEFKSGWLFLTSTQLRTRAFSDA